MAQGHAAIAPPRSALAGLFAGAIVWGLIWYPYRVLDAAGVGGVPATTLTYLVALACSVPALVRMRRRISRPVLLVTLGLAAGGCNLGYVVAMLGGEVMRVLLLFYLAPLWTVLLSRALLDERIDAAGTGVVALSLAGAFTMLWRGEALVPMPAVRAEWIGLAAGMLFAFSNVLARKAGDVPIEVKSFAVFAGVVCAGAVLIAAGAAEPVRPRADTIGSIALLGLVLFAVNLAVQHGLAHTPANRAIVIFLVELAVAALSSWALAGEVLGAREWAGGAMIVAASLLSGRMGATPRHG